MVEISAEGQLAEAPVFAKIFVSNIFLSNISLIDGILLSEALIPIAYAVTEAV